MTRISALVLIAAILAVPGAVAQTNASPPGTNSAGTEQSSGKAPNRQQGTGGGLGTGNAKLPDTPNGDAAINQENAILDRKLKSICRGC